MTTRDAGAVPGTRSTGLYVPLSWALLRAPLLPATATVSGDEPLVRAALAVASPDLAQALDKEPPRSARRAARQQQRLLRYLIRMRTRSTPFGLLAGVALVTWGTESDIALSAQRRTRTRPDMEWLLGLVDALERDEGIRPALHLRADPAVLMHGGRVFRSGGDGHEVSVRATKAARWVLEATRQPTTWQELVDALARRPGGTHERAAAMVDALWRQGFLHSELRPPLTGGDPATHVASRLQAIPAGRDMGRQLAAGLGLLAQVDALPLEGRATHVSGATEALESLSPRPAGGSTTQVDMAWSLEPGRLAAAVGHAAAQAAELLVRLHPHPTGPPHLVAYRRAFLERYGGHRQVRLLELLNPELGLGPPTPSLPAPPTSRDRLLAHVAVEALREGRRGVELDDRLLGMLTTWDPDPATSPRSLDLTVLVAAESTSAIDRGDFQLVVGPNYGVEGAGRTLGRFADVLGPAAETALHEAAAADADAAHGRLLVEVVHAPLRARSANVAVRPAVRSYEISLGGVTPGVPEAQLVPVEQLVVGATSGRLFVRWPEKDCEVVVVQGHMLNRALAPPVARFLLDLAGDGRCGLTGFDWGRTASALPFLPRVQRGRVVLSLARWRLQGEGPGMVNGELEAWCARWAVPEQVYLSASDQRLLLDLGDPDHRAIVEEELQRNGAVELQEALPGVESAWLSGPDGLRFSELVVPLTIGNRSAPPEQPVETTETTETTETGIESLAKRSGQEMAVATKDRLRMPGSDWLYVKLYGPASFQDALIAGALAEFSTWATSAGLADGWFFVRYADPDPHLRVRWHGDATNLLGPLLREAVAWAQGLVREGICHRFAIDTYEREVERYGGLARMDEAEALFCADSASVAEVLASHQAGHLSRDLLTIAVVSVDDLLGHMGLDVNGRCELYAEWAPLTPEGGEEYRRRQTELRPLLGTGDPARAAGVQALLAPRRGLQLDPPSSDVARAHVHMHLNRLLSPPVTESAVLELLRRTRTGLLRSHPPA